MYRILSLGNGKHPSRQWTVGDTCTDDEFERVARLFLSWKAEGQRLALVWVPDDEHDVELPPLPNAAA